MGLFSFLASVGGAIATAVSSIGSAIGRGVSAVVGTIATAIEKGASWLGGVMGAFAKGLLDAMGVTRPEESVEDFGERVLQARERGIELDRAEDFDAYVEALRGFELDPERAARRNPAEQLAAAMAVGTVAVERRYGLGEDTAAALWLLPVLDRDYFTPERVRTLLESGRGIVDLVDYLRGRTTPDVALALARDLAAMDPAPGGDGLGDVRERLLRAKQTLAAMEADFDAVVERLGGATGAQAAPGASRTWPCWSWWRIGWARPGRRPARRPATCPSRGPATGSIAPTRRPCATPCGISGATSTAPGPCSA